MILLSIIVYQRKASKKDVNNICGDMLEIKVTIVCLKYQGGGGGEWLKKWFYSYFYQKLGWEEGKSTSRSY